VRLLLLQFGDYAEAAHRFERGQDETYYAQRYTVAHVAALAAAGAAVRVVALGADAPLERLASGVESMGLQLYRGRLRGTRLGALKMAAAAFAPTHLLLQTPLPAMVRWAVARGVRVLPLLADSFHAGGLRQRLRSRRLAAALNAPEVPWVANHGPNAAADLVRIGVDPRKVVAFDWPALLATGPFAPKQAPADPSRLRLVYAGAVTEAKGVGDLIDAIALARAAGCTWQLTIAGAGELDGMRALAERRGVAGHVVHVSSMAGHRVPGPDSAVYAGTKFAVRAITEGLRQELRARKSPIRVSCVSPGYVDTEFAQVFAGPEGAATTPPIKVLESIDVARAVVWVLAQPAHVEVHDVLLRPTGQRN